MSANKEKIMIFKMELLLMIIVLEKIYLQQDLGFNKN